MSETVRNVRISHRPSAPRAARLPRAYCWAMEIAAEKQAEDAAAQAKELADKLKAGYTQSNVGTTPILVPPAPPPPQVTYNDVATVHAPIPTLTDVAVPAPPPRFVNGVMVG